MYRYMTENYARPICGRYFILILRIVRIILNSDCIERRGSLSNELSSQNMGHRNPMCGSNEGFEVELPTLRIYCQLK